MRIIDVPRGVSPIYRLCISNIARPPAFYFPGNKSSLPQIGGESRFLISEKLRRKKGGIFLTKRKKPKSSRLFASALLVSRRGKEKKPGWDRRSVWIPFIPRGNERSRDRKSAMRLIVRCVERCGLRKDPSINRYVVQVAAYSRNTSTNVRSERGLINTLRIGNFSIFVTFGNPIADIDNGHRSELPFGPLDRSVRNHDGETGSHRIRLCTLARHEQRPCYLSIERAAPIPHTASRPPHATDASGLGLERSQLVPGVVR